MATVEAGGRIAVPGSVLRPLGWDSSTRIALREQDGLVVLITDPAGSPRVSTTGRTQMPVAIRRWCGLTTGSRVMLVADPDVQRLAVVPSTVLDELMTRRFADAFGGDPS